MELLSFEGAARHDPAIDAWLDGHAGDLGDRGDLGTLARTWFERLRESGDLVRELMHDGRATVCVGDVPWAYVAVYPGRPPGHVGLGFFLGAHLPDPAGLLEGTGKRMRHVKLRPGATIDEDALRALIAAAHDDVCERLDLA